MATNSLANIHHITIDGISLKPQEMTMTISDVDYDAGRNDNGTMIRNIVATKRSYSVIMPPCSTATIQPLLAKLTPAGHTTAPSFTCTFPDPIQGTYTGTFYISDRTAPIYNFRMDIWNRWSFDLVEI